VASGSSPIDTEPQASTSGTQVSFISSIIGFIVADFLTFQCGRAPDGWYPIRAIVREGPVYNPDGSLWDERGLLVDHQMLVYRQRDIFAPDLEAQATVSKPCRNPPEIPQIFPKIYDSDNSNLLQGPINKPGSGEEFMFAHSAAEEIEKERRRKRGRDPSASCRFCEKNIPPRDSRYARARKMHWSWGPSSCS